MIADFLLQDRLGSCEFTGLRVLQRLESLSGGKFLASRLVGFSLLELSILGNYCTSKINYDHFFCINNYLGKFVDGPKMDVWGLA